MANLRQTKTTNNHQMHCILPRLVGVCLIGNDLQCCTADVYCCANTKDYYPKVPSMKNKTILITGASRGIGAAAAREFASLGANVMLSARSETDIKAIADEINSNGGKAAAIACDVSDLTQVKAMTDACIATFGALDVLINNAGVIDPINSLADADPTTWDKLIDINVKGVYYGIREALPHMKNGGTIITIGSGAGTSPLEGWSAYCASKAAVHHLNACLDKEERENGIRALVLSPGTVATDMQMAIKDSGVNPVSQLDWSVHIPPEWPAKALVWMCTADANEWLGQVISLREDPIRKRIGLVP
jgi:NAD(P)-dependent dehydrogenase (short-subunit alcohol dehydrogenase family)